MNIIINNTRNSTQGNLGLFRNFHNRYFRRECFIRHIWKRLHGKLVYVLAFLTILRKIVIIIADFTLLKDTNRDYMETFPRYYQIIFCESRYFVTNPKFAGRLGKDYAKPPSSNGGFMFYKDSNRVKSNFVFKLRYLAMLRTYIFYRE